MWLEKLLLYFGIVLFNFHQFIAIAIAIMVCTGTNIGLSLIQTVVCGDCTYFYSDELRFDIVCNQSMDLGQNVDAVFEVNML